MGDNRFEGEFGLTFCNYDFWESGGFNICFMKLGFLIDREFRKHFKKWVFEKVEYLVSSI